MRRIFGLLILVGLSTPAFGAPVVWDTQVGGNGNAYQIIRARYITWDRANTIAQSLTFQGVQGHLATIASAEENTFVNDLRRRSLKRGRWFRRGPTEVWLGGFQSPSAQSAIDGWQWVNGGGNIPGTNGGATYTNWAPGEPNNWGGREDKLAMGFRNSGMWNDEGYVGNIAGFVVEYDTGGPVKWNAVPEPASVAMFGLGLLSAGYIGRRKKKEAQERREYEASKVSSPWLGRFRSQL